MSIHRKRNKNLGLTELVAIALGGIVSGGIFKILGISVSMNGNLTPFDILIGILIAPLAAYSYVKLGLYYRDEGATYSLCKLTYPNSHFKASAIGWFIIFGYISTLALYAYTFSSYVISSTTSPKRDRIDYLNDQLKLHRPMAEDKCLFQRNSESLQGFSIWCGLAKFNAKPLTKQ